MPLGVKDLTERSRLSQRKRQYRQGMCIGGRSQHVDLAAFAHPMNATGRERDSREGLGGSHLPPCSLSDDRGQGSPFQFFDQCGAVDVQ